MAQPSVSCIVLAEGATDADVACVVYDFTAQSYEAKRLLLSVGPDDAARVAVLCRGRHDVSVVIGPVEGSHGRRANAAMAHTRDDLVTFWELHDRQHPLRLAEQVAAIAPGGAGCCLPECLYLFRATGRMSWVDCRLGPVQGCGGMIPGTLLAWRGGLTWPDSNDPAGLFQAASRRGGTMVQVVGQPWLTIKVIERGCTLTDRAVIDVERRGVSFAALREAKETLEEGLAGYQYGTSRSYRVVAGRGGGVVYEIDTVC